MWESQKKLLEEVHLLERSIKVSQADAPGSGRSIHKCAGDRAWGHGAAGLAAWLDPGPVCRQGRWLENQHTPVTKDHVTA